MVNCLSQKPKSWELLNHLKTFVEGPWLCIGDFNAFLQSSEKLSKRLAQVSQVEDFRVALEECQLEDLGFKGYPYTWNYKRPGESNTRIRLDRAIATREWREKFQLSSVMHLAPHLRKGFKFKETWLLWEDCEDVVKEAWSMEHNDGHRLAMVQQKIWCCSDQLNAWGVCKARPNNEEIKQLQKRLENLNMEETTDASKAEFLEVSKELDDL